jgi:uncharacterized protein YabE (DUF348 family)
VVKKFFRLEIGWLNYHIPLWAFAAGLVVVLGLAVSLTLASVWRSFDSEQERPASKLVTIYDQGAEKTILTRVETVAEALSEAGVAVDSSDTVEPSVDTFLVANSYSVNIYRARPVVVRDGGREQRVITAAQTGKTIAKVAGIALSPEDEVALERNADILTGDGAIIVAEVDRATPVRLVLYGQANQFLTQADTVGEFLREKGINTGSDVFITPSVDAAISAEMDIRVWREGINTITIDEDVPFDTEQVQSNDYLVGYRQVQTLGANGRRSVAYEVEMRGGVEVGRREIQSVITVQPVSQVEIVGIKRTGTVTTPSENQTITWNYLRAQGFSREQTAGIMGNLQQEHGFQTSGDGLAQWTGGRKASLMSREDPYNIYTQLDFLMYELNGGYARVKAAILATSSVEDATIVFQNQFERCGICVQDRRIQFAYNILASH